MIVLKAIWGKAEVVNGSENVNYLLQRLFPFFHEEKAFIRTVDSVAMSIIAQRLKGKWIDEP